MAFSTKKYNGWCPFLEFRHTPISINKLRFFQNYSLYDAVDLDVYYNNSWNNTYEGEFETDHWNIFDVAQTAQLVEKARIRFHTLTNNYCYINELSFGQGELTPKVDIKADNLNGPITINYNKAVTLSWDSTNIETCLASGSWAGQKLSSGSESSGSLMGPAQCIYTLTCSGPKGQATDSVIVNVSARKSEATYGENKTFKSPQE
jgi:hypothetical protein